MVPLSPDPEATRRPSSKKATESIHTCISDGCWMTLYGFLSRNATAMSDFARV